MIEILLDTKIVLTLCILATTLFIVILKTKKLQYNSARALLCIYVDFILCLCFLYYFKFSPDINYIFIFIWLLFSVIAIIISKILKVYNTKIGVFFTIFIIFIVQLGYISYTPFTIRQHDQRSFVDYMRGGHLGYIGYIFYNNKLPSGSPVDYWCFYNPPFFYIISAIFIKIQNFLNIELNECLENLQVMTLLYVTVFNIFVYKILKQMNIKKSITYILSFVGLIPLMIIMSGNLSNGTLSVMLSTIAIYYTIKWYNSNRLSDLIKIAFAISLAIMTKIDAALIAIVIAGVFLVKVIKNKADIKKYIKYFSIFAIISLPIGLWYPIKNLVLYDVPITYVQSVEKDHEASVEKYTAFQRFFTLPSNENVKNINITMVGPNVDYNIIITTIKSLIVDESIDYSQNKILDITIHLIFICLILITINFVICIIYLIKNYNKINNHWILFFMALLVIEGLAYVKFCFDFPFTFTMNFRYIIPTLVSFSVLTGIACEENKSLLNVNKVLLGIFSILSVIMFLLIR